MKTLARLAGCWLAYVAGLVVFSVVVGVLKLHMNAPAQRSSPGMQFLLALLAGAVLVAGIFPMARGLAGGATTRMATMAAFLVLVFGVNTMIEISVFTKLLQGSFAGSALYYACMTLPVGLAAGLMLGGNGEAAGLRRAGAGAWLGRVLIAWLCWPVIYFLFGMCVAPVVTPYYHSIPWLRIPPLGTIVGIQLLRSPIFLAASLPLIALWKGSRRGLWLALGLAHLVVVGLFGLAGSTFFPVSMRVAHSLEIAGDSFVYAGLLVALFSAAGGRQAPAETKAWRAVAQAH